jgi:putative membrane protein
MGVAISIISLAKVLEYLFTFYPVYIWAYFFGLILASIYFVGRTIEKWSFSITATFLIGAAAAFSISFLNPATENEGFIYLTICGVVAICSMILPGLSGSFVLILMGNYQLVVIDAVTNIRMGILLPVLIGAGVGLVAFSHLLSWIYKKYRNQTIATLTGFIFGSLAILWPWKDSFNETGELIATNNVGAFVTQNGDVITEEIKVFSYNQVMPAVIDKSVVVAVGLVVLGIVSIWLMEKFAGNKEETK